MQNIIEVILGWPDAIKGFEINALAGYLNKSLHRNVTKAEIDAAMAQLRDLERVDSERGVHYLTEPDRPELDLYAPLEAAFQVSGVFAALGIDRHEWVFQKTATSGVRSAGRLSMPDFTLAAIRSWRFDPRRSLEVYSFEVKRRAGTSLASVYEAVAHGRFIHHPYLVCPRSVLEPLQNAQLKTACAREGVGLIFFDIVVDPFKNFRLERLEVIEKAVRRTPDPQEVEAYLSKRLTAANCLALESIVKGAQA